MGKSSVHAMPGGMKQEGTGRNLTEKWVLSMEKGSIFSLLTDDPNINSLSLMLSTIASKDDENHINEYLAFLKISELTGVKVSLAFSVVK